MSPIRGKLLVLSRPGELQALVSPLRVEIVEHVQSAGPSSVREIAEALGRSPQSLYYHVRALASAGIFVQRATRKRPRRDEAVYSLAAERIAISKKPWTAQKASATARSVGALLRRAERNFRRAVLQDLVRGTPEAPHAFAGGRRAWMTEPGIRSLARLIGEIEQLLKEENHKNRKDSKDDQKKGRLCLWTFAFAPMAGRLTGRTPR
jgi:DNA-binding transcriptional ArsR family regulator